MVSDLRLRPPSIVRPAASVGAVLPTLSIPSDSGYQPATAQKPSLGGGEMDRSSPRCGSYRPFGDTITRSICRARSELRS